MGRGAAYHNDEGISPKETTVYVCDHAYSKCTAGLVVKLLRYAVEGLRCAHPIAALMLLWFGNLVPTKWLVTQPTHEIATRTACPDSLLSISTRRHVDMINPRAPFDTRALDSVD
jgi:hypothetical protein